jgi:putative ABC transport system substrate-binding protein
MGGRLASLALAQIDRPGSAPAPTGVEPLQDLAIAVNVRTAAHLGLQFGTRQIGEFDLVFPNP